MSTSADSGIARLLTWLSPAFPIGSYSYSHGIEYAVATDLIVDAPGLRAWIESILRHGSGRTDAILLGEAWRAERDRDEQKLENILEWAEAFRGTAELALESGAQGRAFLQGVRAAWPHPHLDALLKLAAKSDRAIAYAVAFGVAAAALGIDLGLARLAFLQAFAAALVSAGVRLIPLGQSDGLRVLAGLEETGRAVAEETADLGLRHLAAATWMVDWTSARHETQYTRLFRS